MNKWIDCVVIQNLFVIVALIPSLTTVLASSRKIFQLGCLFWLVCLMLWVKWLKVMSFIRALIIDVLSSFLFYLVLNRWSCQSGLILWKLQDLRSWLLMILTGTMSELVSFFFVYCLITCFRCVKKWNYEGSLLLKVAMICCCVVCFILVHLIFVNIIHYHCLWEEKFLS